MKILSVTTLYPSEAAPQSGVFVRSRLQAMAEMAEVIVVAPQPLVTYQEGRPQLGRLSQRHSVDGKIEVLRPVWFYPPAAGAFNPLFLAARILPTVIWIRRRFRFDLIDAHFGYPTGVAAWLLAKLIGIPFSITLRGSETLHADHALRRWSLKKALRGAARVIAVSERLREFAISAGVDPSRALTVPNGVDGSLFRYRTQSECRAKLGLDPQQRIILTAGHLIELKGHHRVIAALAGLPGAHLYIAGGPGGVASNEDQLRMQVRLSGIQDRVHFLGPVDQQTLAALMGASDLFCLASSREGWPNVVQEALSCGTPVVAADVGAIPQMITDRVGIIVPPGDDAALQSALERALATCWSRESIAAFGSRRSWPQVGNEVMTVLAGLGMW